MLYTCAESFLVGFIAWTVTGIDDISDLFVRRALGLSGKNTIFGFLLGLAVTIFAGIFLSGLSSKALSSIINQEKISLIGSIAILSLGIIYLVLFYGKKYPKKQNYIKKSKNEIIEGFLSYIVRGFDDIAVYATIFLKDKNQASRLFLVLGIFIAAIFILLFSNYILYSKTKNDIPRIRKIGKIAALILIIIGIWGIVTHLGSLLNGT